MSGSGSDAGLTARPRDVAAQARYEHRPGFHPFGDQRLDPIQVSARKSPQSAKRGLWRRRW